MLENRLNKRKSLGNLRELHSSTTDLIDFASNDYLGLARSQELLADIQKEWNLYQNQPKLVLKGVGSSGSRLLTGNSRYAEIIEEEIAQFHGFEDALLFGCGYMANVGLLSSLGKEATILYDAAIHASMRDGIRLSQAVAYPFRHQDLNHLEQRLKSFSQQKHCFICIESIYSTYGSIAPLLEISKLAEKYNTQLIVDEAHAVGLFGDKGQGLVNTPVFAKVVTFGKALGTYGAVILGSKQLKNYLLNFAHASIYTTALPFHNLAAIRCSYRILPFLHKERTLLIERIDQFSSGMQSTPIQPVSINGNARVKQAATFLKKHGFQVSALMSPTVRQGEEILRICLHSFNTEDEVKALIDLIDFWRQKNE